METRTGRHRRPASPARRGALVTAAWLAAVVAAPRQDVPGVVHGAALFAHLAALVVGFGAVLLVDWFGLLWLTGRRTLADVLDTARGAHVPTWLGFAGLLGSGALLAPEPSPLTSVKLVAVLVVGLNGVYAGTLLSLLAHHTGRPPARLLVRAGLAATVSQAAWWTAVVVGFLNSRP